MRILCFIRRGHKEPQDAIVFAEIDCPHRDASEWALDLNQKDSDGRSHRLRVTPLDDLAGFDMVRVRLSRAPIIHITVSYGQE